MFLLITLFIQHLPKPPCGRLDWTPPAIWGLYPLLVRGTFHWASTRVCSKQLAMTANIVGSSSSEGYGFIGKGSRSGCESPPTLKCIEGPISRRLSAGHDWLFAANGASKSAQLPVLGGWTHGQTERHATQHRNGRRDRLPGSGQRLGWSSSA